MSSRARSPSVESVSEISLHRNDDMYGTYFQCVQIRSPRTTHNRPARSRQHGLLSRSVSTSSHRFVFYDFEVRSEYRASRSSRSRSRKFSVVY